MVWNIEKSFLSQRSFIFLPILEIYLNGQISLLLLSSIKIKYKLAMCATPLTYGTCENILRCFTAQGIANSVVKAVPESVSQWNTGVHGT